LDLWAAVSVVRGHQPALSIKRDMDTIDSLQGWRPPENPEIIDEWEAQQDFVMLVNLYTLSVTSIRPAMNMTALTGTRISSSSALPVQYSRQMTNPGYLLNT